MTDKQQPKAASTRIITDQEAIEITRVEELSYDLKVSEVMTKGIKTVSPDHCMADLLETLRSNRISGVPVLSNNELIGIISLEDLIRCLHNQDIQSTVSKYMSSQIVTVNSYDPLIEAIEKFTRLRMGRFPVIDEMGTLVGMITKGDITRGVLTALQKDIHVEEVRRYRASHLFDDINSDRTSLILRYNIKARDFTHGGNASSNIKRALLRLGANPQIARRCGIAVYEAEMNLIIHTTNGGIIKVEIESHRILMKATDDGPGIEDVEMAMSAGYSTATEEVRELGFGAGMGLFNIKRFVDKMVLESTPGKGTKLEMYIFLQPRESFRDASHFGQEEKTTS
jgi:CBS domain-containing protein